MEGFLSLQMLITYILAIGGVNKMETTSDYINFLTNFTPPVVKMQRFPYASWVEDKLLQALESFVGIIIMLSFVYTCINTVKVITTEKEKQLKVNLYKHAQKRIWSLIHFAKSCLALEKKHTSMCVKVGATGKKQQKSCYFFCNCTGI